MISSVRLNQVPAGHTNTHTRFLIVFEGVCVCGFEGRPGNRTLPLLLSGGELALGQWQPVAQRIHGERAGGTFCLPGFSGREMIQSPTWAVSSRPGSLGFWFLALVGFPYNPQVKLLVGDLKPDSPATAGSLDLKMRQLSGPKAGRSGQFS